MAGFLMNDALLREPQEGFGPLDAQDRTGYGFWSFDEAGLPCFHGRFLTAAGMERSFLHGFSSGRLNVFCNRWGLVHLFTTEGGYTDLSANAGRVRSGLYLELVVGGERHALVHDDLMEKSVTRYGVGYARYEGLWCGSGNRRLQVHQEFYAPPDREPRMGAQFGLRNCGPTAIQAILRIRSDIEPGGVRSDGRKLKHGQGFTCWENFHPGLGDFQLRADASFHGKSEGGVSLILEKELTLDAGAIVEISAQAGYGKPLPPCPDPEESRELWMKRLAPLRLDGVEDWMHREALWSFSQLCSFEAYDSSVGEHYLNLGGYGWVGFGVREVPETAMTVAAWDPVLAFSCLRWTAKLQYSNGNLPHCHAFRRAEPGQVLETGREESDSEIWFVQACAEVLLSTGRHEFLDEVVPFWEGGSGTILEHLRRAVSWIREGIGTGRHGLIRMADGDWNDYLSGVGRGGYGESMMNTGIACAALSALAPLVESRDPAFARSCREFLSALREAAGRAFDGEWFVRGYTDEGRPFGTVEEDRLFLNAQSWCVLGGCGTTEMRKIAMRSALDKCWSPLGLTLMSRPYSCPPPPDVSDCPIPAGEGENAGIWPQTVHWAIWALASLGWKEEGLDLWKRMSLQNHATLHPETPFGIFNGPDCYSSHFSGEREGWTQVEMLERSKFPPMNPMVAWQAFSLSRLLEIRASFR